MDRGRVAAIPFFAGLPDQEIDAVARVASEVEFATGQALTTEGEFGHGLFPSRRFLRVNETLDKEAGNAARTSRVV